MCTVLEHEPEAGAPGQMIRETGVRRIQEYASGMFQEFASPTLQDPARRGSQVQLLAWGVETTAIVSVGKESGFKRRAVACVLIIK